MGRKDTYITKYAQKAIDDLLEVSDLTIKEIMSAGVLAFNDLSPDEQGRYVIKAKMGALAEVYPKKFDDAVNVICQTDFHLMSDAAKDQMRVWAVTVFGPEALKPGADIGGAAGADADADAAEAAGEAQIDKDGRRTG